jgi:hypothetical protein
VGVQVRDPKLCDRCRVYVGNRPQVTYHQSPMYTIRLRLCVRCSTDLTDRIQDTVDEWLILEQLAGPR